MTAADLRAFVRELVQNWISSRFGVNDAAGDDRDRTEMLVRHGIAARITCTADYHFTVVWTPEGQKLLGFQSDVLEIR